ncbi:MAG: alanine racemase [Clostridia bacterium]|nr:alanine racemase [Clostridia bacterium]
MLRDTHLKINLDTLIANLEIVQSHLSKKTEIGAVLKANAYGHGSKVIAKTLMAYGLSYFLVATLLEGIQLRNEDSRYQILIMGHTPDHLLEQAILKNLELTIFTYEQGLLIHQLAQKHKTTATVHIKIETGFNRLGFSVNEKLIPSILKLSLLKHLNIKGIFTHLALRNKNADENQFQVFQKVIRSLEEHNVEIPLKHVCDSIGMTLYPHMHMDMVRIGALLYGLQGEEKFIPGIQQILKMETKFSHIKILEEDSFISYGMRKEVKKGSRIGTLPFGYADGYPRALYKDGFVCVNGDFYPFAGVICMDQCMIDLGNANFESDDIVSIIDTNQLSISKLAKKVQTNKNEFVSSLAARLPRLYIRHKKPYLISYEMLGETHELY